MELHYVKHFKKYRNDTDGFLKRFFPRFFKKENTVVKHRMFVYDIGFVYYLKDGEPYYKKIRNCVEFYKNKSNDLVVINFNKLTRTFEEQVFNLGRLDWQNSTGVLQNYEIQTIKEIKKRGN